MPELIDFGPVPVGSTARQMTTLENPAGSALEIRDISFTPASDAFAARLMIGDPLRGAVLPQNGAVPVVIEFLPSVLGDASATLMASTLVHSSQLSIKGAGSVPAPPSIIAAPPSLAFGSVELHRDAVSELRVRNQGKRPATLQAVQLGASASPFRLTLPSGADPTGAVLAAGGGELGLEAHFAPSTTGDAADVFQLAFDSDDTGSADDPPQLVTLQAHGTAVQDAALVCQTSSVAFGPVVRGSAASATVHCTVLGPGQFTLARVSVVGPGAGLFAVPDPPAGLDGSGALDVRVVFVSAGVAQTAKGTLEVAGADGSVVGIPLTGQVTAAPPGQTDLTLTLDWDTAGTDFDLHLVRSGAAPFSPIDDCFYAHKAPDWGVIGESDDNPYLDADNTTGYGPEVINLLKARESVYDAYVQFYGFSLPPQRPTTVFVTFALRGGTPRTYQASMDTCGSTWHFGRFRMDRSPPDFEPDGAISGTWRASASTTCQ